MNQQLAAIQDLIVQHPLLIEQEKKELLKLIESADIDFSKTESKLDCTEEVKRTTAILLEETLEELEQKRKEVESQNKELEIEAALECIRSRTLQMKDSSELADAASIFFNQFSQLGFLPQNARTYFTIIDKDKQAGVVWLTKADGTVRQGGHLVPFTTNKPLLQLYEAIEEKKPIHIRDLSGDILNDYLQFLSTLPHVRNDKALQQLITNPPKRIVFTDAIHLYGTVGIMAFEPISEDAQKTLTRFAKVFEFTYTRFADLQTAEAQAREAKIEASLERVRSKSMAMHNSDDVTAAISTLYIELEKLGTNDFRGGVINIRKDGTSEVWSVSNLAEGKITRGVGKFEMNAHPLWLKLFEGWIKKEEFFLYHLVGKDKEEYINILNRSNYLSQPLQYFPDALFQACYFDEGAIWSFSLKPHLEEEKQLIKRFTAVFSQTFRRYQDLQKAEAQAREANIEAALEKVRSRSLAMHKSEELQVVVNTLFVRLTELNVKIDSANIAIFKEGTRDFEYWVASDYQNRMESFRIPYTDLLLTTDLIAARESGTDFFGKTYTFEEKNKWFKYAFRDTDFKFLDNERKQMILDAKALTISIAFAKNTGVQVIRYSSELVSEAEIEILKRFAKVFDQAYTRFLDLQKAESSAREAQIEASLERVRARTMAMHSSEDVTGATETMFTELHKLGIDTLRCGIANIHLNRTFDVFGVTNLNTGNTMSGFGLFGMDEHPIWKRWFESWKNTDEVFIAYLAGQEKEEYFNNINNHQGYLPQQIVQFPDNFFQAYHFDQGAVWTYSLLEHTQPEKEIMKRFASVFSLTFRRYQDLKKAEANAREAIKQAALDRIRAEIASMRTITDLDRITPLIWNELTILGVPFIRCGVFIMDDAQQLIHTFLSTPEGKAIAAFKLPYDTPGHFEEVIEHWRTRKIYIEHWSEVDFISISETLVKQGAIATREQYLDTLPKGVFLLHFLPFLQGMLYVANIDRLSQEDINLLQHVADAFSTAYARYEDFNKLEAAKQQVDKTLGDLKQAQKQLIQSEKMASLGELTAGIAHEIQNPLNFINNFSDVSNELIDEMKEEMATGNRQLATELADDIKKNLGKINHHGKRADAIVKGMLQHSRSSTDKKEPTDINALANEYLRLSYHGFRAKDNAFDAIIQTNFDESIGKIEVIPQDIGRVLLNLYNNAFYAASLPSKGGFNNSTPNNHKPTVWVTTTKLPPSGGGGAGISISVKDNGPGIPEKILGKIFQPFFTTKPTGQGTGLGLSLSYDIVKAHGGDLKVETKEGEFTSFAILLPHRNDMF